MDKQPMYIQQKRFSEISFSVRTRQEAINKFYEFINSLEYDFRITIAVRALCASPMFLDPDSVPNPNEIESLIHADELNLPTADDHKS